MESQLTFIKTSSNPNESFYIIPTLLDITLQEALNLIQLHSSLHNEHGEITVILPQTHINTESYGTFQYYPQLTLSIHDNTITTIYQELLNSYSNKTIQMATAYQTYGNRTNYTIHLNQDNLSK